MSYTDITNMVVEIKAKIREWGGSWGATLSKEELQKAHIKPGDEVRVLIFPITTPLKESFGKFKLKRPVAQLMREIDREMDYD